jgi:hypothetical protein
MHENIINNVKTLKLSLSDKCRPQLQILNLQERCAGSTAGLLCNGINLNMYGDTRGMTGREQVVISRLRTGYTRATHGPRMNGITNTQCPFCDTGLTVDHVLWDCKETEKNQKRDEDDTRSMEKRRRRNEKDRRIYEENWIL